MTTIELTPKQILLQAAQHIETHGKTEGSYYEPPKGLIRPNQDHFDSCRMCLVGSIGFQATGNPIHLGNRWGFIAAQAVRRKLGLGYMTDVFAWSDSHTAAEVVAVLRETAATLPEEPPHG